jgi:glycosyltransferase involved in cell wall biosynthesis
MSRPRTNICLNMIVKNETKVLPRLFRSLNEYIDYYVIVDTGSTDDTIALIKSEMGAYGIDGEVHERPWVNFGTNRQQALELAVAAGKADWVLFIDADEELGVGDPKFYEKLEPGTSYDIEKHQGGTRYVAPALLNIKANRYRWEGPVHNYIVTLEGPKRRPVRKDVWIVYHTGEGAKSHGLTAEQKFLRDAKLLEEDLVLHPESARSQFYLAQSYRDAGHLERAYAEYKKRAQMNGWAEETYMAQLEAGRVALVLDLPEEVVVREYLDAFELRPTRAEPLHDLARYFRLKKQYGKAYVFARTGVERPLPDDTLFIAYDVYEWKMLDELGVVAYFVGDYETAKEACETVLARVERGVITVPPGDLQRIRENLGHALKGLGAEPRP